MELLLITEDKLKILLSRDDLGELGITCEEIDYGNTETRRVFWYLLDEAKHITGFDAANSRIFIQIYPDVEGGCEMYVSRLGETDGNRNKLGGKKVTCSIHSEHDLRREDRIYRFGSLDDMLQACRELRAHKYSGASSAYIDEDGEYCYLIVACVRGDNCILSEYGESRSASGLRYYINEHCREIRANDAVGVLSEL